MAVLLHIDTATPVAGVCLSRGEAILGWEEHADQKSHASFLHAAIKRLLDHNQLTAGELDGVAVTIGPGSYTGLRVSLAAAKGICFALSKPLIAINTLEFIAFSAAQSAPDFSPDMLIVPMIDARRMEVYTAVYDSAMETVLTPHALIIDESSFHSFRGRRMLFCGNGMPKYENFIKEKTNKSFFSAPHSITHMVPLSLQKYQHQRFEDLAYSEPDYGKAFFSPSHKN